MLYLLDIDRSECEWIAEHAVEVIITVENRDCQRSLVPQRNLRPICQLPIMTLDSTVRATFFLRVRAGGIYKEILPYTPWYESYLMRCTQAGSIVVYKLSIYIYPLAQSPMPASYVRQVRSPLPSQLLYYKNDLERLRGLACSAAK